MRRAAASAALFGAAILAVTGCTFVADIQTAQVYDAGDGVSAEVGDVEVHNTIAFSSEGELVSLVFSAYNGSERSVRLNVSVIDDGQQLTEQVWLDAGSLTTFGDGYEREIVFEGIDDLMVGSYLPVYVQYGDESGQLMQVPVLDGRLDAYATLVPTAAPTPVPEPTAEPSGSATEEPANEEAAN